MPTTNKNFPLVFAGVIAESHDRVLMLRHTNPSTPDFFTPPFVGVEEDGHLRDIVKNHCFATTGVLVQPRELIYVEEMKGGENVFLMPGMRGLRLWFRGDVLDGDALDMQSIAPGEKTHAVWMTHTDIMDSPVFPLLMQYDYWLLRQAGFDNVRYLIL